MLDAYRPFPYIVVVKKKRSGIPTFFIELLIPQFLFSERKYGKRYNAVTQLKI